MGCLRGSASTEKALSKRTGGISLTEQQNDADLFVLRDVENCGDMIPGVGEPAIDESSEKSPVPPL
jgi:hypothetical protein